MSHHGHVARKRFGQHFLIDQVLIDDIVHGVHPQVGEAILEIGPGLGALTHALLKHGAKPLTVIEIDRDLAARWRRNEQVNVIEADVLTVDFRALAVATNQPGWRLVGNLPYNISTPILFHLLDHVDVVIDQHFMLQKEVVDRMVAAPRTKAYGRLSVMLQWRYHLESMLDVPPEAFDPPPRVDSAVVRMTPKAQAPAVDASILKALVAAAFSQRRKLLRHSLGPWLAQHAPSLHGAVDLQRRAEEVPVDEYIAMAQAVSALPNQEAPAQVLSARGGEHK